MGQRDAMDFILRLCSDGRQAQELVFELYVGSDMELLMMTPVLPKAIR